MKKFHLRSSSYNRTNLIEMFSILLLMSFLQFVLMSFLRLNISLKYKRMYLRLNKYTSPVYTIKVFHQKLWQRKLCQSTLFTRSKLLMGIGGKCKDNIYMADFEEYVALYVCILCTLILRRRLRRLRVRPRRMWSRAWLQRRRTRSCYNTLLQELRAEDIDEYKNYMRMSKETFNMLLEKVCPYIEKQDSLLSLVLIMINFCLCIPNNFYFLN